MLTKKTKNFEIKAFVDQNRKKLVHSILYKRKKVKTTTLTDTLSKEYNERALLISDLKRVLDWVEFLIDIDLDSPDNFIIIDSLFTSISITYYKCFASTQNKIRKRLQLSKKNIKLNKHVKTDELLYDLRMKFVAHRGSTEFEYHTLVKVIASEKYPSMIVPIKAKAQRPNKKLVIDIKELVVFLLSQAKEENRALLSIIESRNT